MAEGSSDRPIVIGDGKAVHKVKEPAEVQSEQSTHAGERNTPRQSVSRTLHALREKARREPKHKFRGLARLIDVSMLVRSFHELKRKAAPGVDGVVWAEYEKDLERNLRELHGRLRSGRYRARIVRRRYIEKANGKRRPLGIPVLEDKIVQQAVRKILESIFEVDFRESSMGYRLGKGAREAGQKLQEQLFFSHVHWVVEADIKGFFDHMDHEWLLRMLGERVKDRRLLGLVRKWLKAGVLEEDGKVIHPITGTPQGGVISPVLANIYLHYAMDLWIEKVVRRESRGQVVYLRYADDFVIGCEYSDDAKRIERQLPERLGKFGLETAEEKTRLLKFSRCHLGESEVFTFLGFDFYWAKTRKAKPTIKRRTNAKKFRLSLEGLGKWLRENRNLPVKEWARGVKTRLVGHGNYYGVIGNSAALGRYWNAAMKLCFKWMNRRSQRRSYNWKGFAELLGYLDIGPPRVVERRIPWNQDCWSFA